MLLGCASVIPPLKSVNVVMIARDPASGRVLGESAPVTVQIGK